MTGARIDPSGQLTPSYSREASGNSLALARTEWLLTDGQGGFAMGTAAGIPTRRYHGWLVASMRPPVGRVMTLSSCVEALIENPGSHERRHEFSSFFFPNNSVHPRGHALLKRFETGVTARWEYSLGSGKKPARVTRELCILQPHQRGKSAPGGGAAIVRYSVASEGGPAALEIRPLLAMRDFHELLRAESCPDRFVVSTSPGVVSVEVPALHGAQARLNLAFDGARFVSGAQWWHDFEYPRDAERGQDSREDLFSPGSFVLTVGGREAMTRTELVVWTGAIEDRPTIDFEAAARAQRERAEGLSSQAVSRARESPTGPVARLTAAGDRFVVRRAGQDGGLSTSVIAGYPWFADWGRDTMISLPGLMLATGRFEEALQTLEVFASLCKNGLIPNLFDDATGQAEYNTVDASLWFVHAACQYATAAADAAVMQGPVGRACLEIITAYRAGTEHKIKMDDDGLIMAGDATTQLTWMDARRDGVVFTPRFGKAVEVNALWYNALESLAGAIEETQPNTARELRSLAERAGASFREKFWNPRSRSCYDCLAPDTPASPQPEGGPVSTRASLQPEGLAESSRGLSESASDTPGKAPPSPHPERVPPPSTTWRPSTETRPNQIFAASLPHSALDREQRSGVVECVRSRLLTPVGLRTLSPSDPGYVGRYRGNLFERDRAYHNGCVWPYLLGPYAEAVLRLGEFSAAACTEARQLLAPLIAEMDSHQPGRLLGQIAEVYDGDDGPDEPRQPGGCPAQAWSVSELLRVYEVAVREGGAMT